MSSVPDVVIELGAPTVIVLASGRGERFIASGGPTHKLQALLEGQTVLAHTLAAVRASGLPWHLEDAGHAGMGDSISAAVRATSGAQGWLILPGDLPLVEAQTLRAVAAALAHHPAVVPVFQGQRGHPVGFARRCGPALAQLSGDKGAGSVLRAQSAIEIMVNDEGCVADIDTLTDLQRASQLLAGRRSAVGPR
ncbi:MAG: nucleotidyltransferase family protein [Rhodoferax sp.]|nr:nucleotidyltransferase family protein [Rhodoferax sp.]MBK9235722.1 nucleotidyltransferase family protein [Rhodoferax sp.]